MNTIEDLNNALFLQLKRLIRPNMSKEDLSLEVSRTRSIVSVSAQIVNNTVLMQKINLVEDQSKVLQIK